MSKKLLVVTGSVRSTRAADNILNQVQQSLARYNFEVQVADFREMPLPMFDSPVIPSDESYAPTNQNIRTWTTMVSEADAVLLLTAEYNHSYTPVIKNAIDWIYKEWAGKPVAFIGYGWAGGARAIKHLRDVFASNINAQPISPEANLRFTKEINLDGTPINQDATKEVDKVLAAL